MSVSQASLAIKELYRTHNTSEKDWNEAISHFEQALEDCDDVDELEKLAVEDRKWELSTDMMLLLLYKAKRLGASSEAFQIQYYGYLAAHLDPSEEQEYADKEVRRLMGVD